MPKGHAALENEKKANEAKQEMRRMKNPKYRKEKMERLKLEKEMAKEKEEKDHLIALRKKNENKNNDSEAHDSSGHDSHWRRSSPPKDIFKRMASANVKNEVDESKWLVGHSVSLLEAHTQGVDPLLNVAKHVGHYAGIALTKESRENRFEVYMEKIGREGLDHPEGKKQKELKLQFETNEMW